MTDAMARYKREMGFDVFMCTGTDEHGQKIEDLAKDAGITPKAYVDGVAGEIKELWDKMNVSYDYFIRTTDDYHEAAVQKIFKKFYEQGDIYKGKYEGWYCTPCESFFTETQAEGGKCPDCGREVQKAEEEAYFFKMSKYADRLMAHIDANPEFTSFAVSMNCSIIFSASPRSRLIMSIGFPLSSRMNLASALSSSSTPRTFARSASISYSLYIGARDLYTALYFL